MWSEHCSYKSTRAHLKKLPTKAPWVIQGPGENAGVIDIGDGDACIFKMESHNHPSPTSSPTRARPPAWAASCATSSPWARGPSPCLNALRFGEPDHPQDAASGVGRRVGIGGYGNSMGVPTVGGSTAFHASYDGNILVNAMAWALSRGQDFLTPRPPASGSPMVYVGSKTGRDGIHGATMASAEFDEDSDEKRPTVQVGDPFTEKLLLEACLEMMAAGAIIAIQDMGAAGLDLLSRRNGRQGRQRHRARSRQGAAAANRT